MIVKVEILIDVSRYLAMIRTNKKESRGEFVVDPKSWTLI